MSTESERLIRDLFFAEKSTASLAQVLTKRLWESQTDSPEELRQFLSFLINAGHYREVWEILSEWMKQNKPLPMRQFCDILNACGFKPGSQFLKYFTQSNNSQPESHQIMFYPQWEKFSQDFIRLKKIHLEKLNQQIVLNKSELFHRLEYFRSNRMIEEEDKLLNELAELYPDDPQIKIDKQRHKERWARAIIAKKSFAALDKEFSETEIAMSDEELLVAKNLVSFIEELVIKKPDRSYNLSILLYNLELYEDCKKILSLAPSSLAVDWLYAEVLIRCRRFVESLDVVSNLEKKYADDPETTFGTTYYRALSLIGLGQIGTAAELLKSIVTIRPNYRSAHTLLHKLGGRIT